MSQALRHWIHYHHRRHGKKWIIVFSLIIIGCTYVSNYNSVLAFTMSSRQLSQLGSFHHSSITANNDLKQRFTFHRYVLTTRQTRPLLYYNYSYTALSAIKNQKSIGGDELDSSRGNNNNNKPNDNDDENLSNDGKKGDQKKNWVKRIGNRFNNKNGNSNNRKENNDNDDKNDRDKNRKLSDTTSTKRSNNNGEKSGLLGNIGKAFKRKPNKESIEDIEFDENNSFNSEITLAKELQKQNELDNYVAGDEIPKEFLPKELIDLSNNNSDPLTDLNKIVAELEDSILYVEKQIQLYRLDQRKFTGDIIPNVLTEDEKRLNRLKRDLEAKRKNVILDDQQRRKNAAMKMKAEKEKIRVASTKQANLRKFGLAIKMEQDADDGEIKVEKGAGAVGKNISNAVDGVMGGAQTALGGAQSALTSVWKKVRNDENTWITVCPKTRISPGEIVPLVIGGVDLLVIGSKDGTKIHCIANTCPHLGTPLESGMIERRRCEQSNAPSFSMSTGDNTKPIINDGFEDCIVCPLHQTAFSLDTGEVNGDWCPYPPVLGKVMGTVKQKNRLPTFKMRTRGKNIQIKINSEILMGDDEK